MISHLHMEFLLFFFVVVVVVLADSIALKSRVYFMSLTLTDSDEKMHISFYKLSFSNNQICILRYGNPTVYKMNKLSQSIPGFVPANHRHAALGESSSEKTRCPNFQTWLIFN